MRSIVLVGAVLALTSASTAADIYCDNNCQPATETHGKYYCVLSNPNKFTMCSNGIRYEIKCGQGLVWDPKTKVCNWPAQSAACSCSATVPTTTTQRASTTTATSTMLFTTTTPTTKASTTTKQSSSTTKAVSTTTKAISTTTTTPSGSNTEYLSICYYTNWAQYRQGSASFKPANIDVSLCSHIIYAFLDFNTSAIRLREWNDDVMIKAILALKAQKPSLKVLASIGGWNAGVAVFSQIASSTSLRSTFNQNAITFLRQYQFDGLDIDYEYPTANERLAYAAWLQELRSAFNLESSSSGKARLLLGAAIGASKAKIDAGYDIPSISQSLDFISVMTYDFHGTWESVTGFNAPLYKMSSWPAGSDLAIFTTSYAVEYLLQKGVPASKLMMGIPLYGHAFRLSNPAQNGVGAPATGAGIQGKYTGQAGFNSYYETCMLSKCTTNPYTYIYNSEVQAPYMFSGNNWISTEDVASVKAKAEFAKSKRIGGVMYWAIDLDDFNDMCQNDVRYPLMKTVSNTLKGLSPPSLNAGNRGTAMCGALISG